MCSRLFESQEKSFRRGASYVVTMVAEFDEYTNDWLYLHEGTVLPKDLLNLNVITSVDLNEWLRTKDSGNETINLGLYSYDMLCTVLHSIKAGSTGLLLGNGVEVDQQNRPQDLLLDWFFHPVLVLKDQMQIVAVFLLDDDVVACTMVGIVRSMSKFPTYWRRYWHVVKLLVAYSVEREGSFGSSASGPSTSFEITRRRVVWLRHFQTFKEKYSALNQNTGVNRSLTEMIRKYHYPGQRMAVGKPEYKKIIEEGLKITCLYDPTVMELMWGIQICMPSLFPEEDAYLTEDDCVPISQGLQNVLSRYGCNYVNSEMVNERIVTMAYILHECDTFEKEKSRDLHRAAVVIKNVSGIDTEGWGLWKIATAVMKIWCVEEARNSCEISEDEVSRLRNDADKYEVKLDKDACLKVSRQMLKVLFFRTRKKGLLEYFVEHAKESYEAE
ncbi:putative membrane protein [Hordeum vulgare]|nr:putative membrane protein [Hordeum vulgare]